MQSTGLCLDEPVLDGNVRINFAELLSDVEIALAQAWARPSQRVGPLGFGEVQATERARAPASPSSDS